jgi:hypothetical protein
MSFPYAYTYRDTDGNTNCYTDSDSDSDSNFNSHACTNTGSSDGTRCNRCDPQQFHCALEQCERCDRLPVGRAHEPVIYHLRAGLSGFGRRQYDWLQCYRIERQYDLLLSATSL